MAKVRMELHEPWWDWWEVSFDHYPLEYRNAGAYHAVHCYNLAEGWPWPERIWYLDFQLERDAKGFLANVLHDPLLLADVCPFCNVPFFYFPRMVRWNIHRGQTREWMGAPFFAEPWPP